MTAHYRNNKDVRTLVNMLCIGDEIVSPKYFNMVYEVIEISKKEIVMHPQPNPIFWQSNCSSYTIYKSDLAYNFDIGEYIIHPKYFRKITPS